MAGLIGHPVHHSLSPALHNAAFAALGLDWVYVAFEVAPGDAAAAVAAMRTLDLAGLSVTMPHKGGVAAAVDRLGPVASRLGVVNTVSWSRSSAGPELIGESTDGAGFVDSLTETGFAPAGRQCVVLGAGGAARAVTLALADAGAAGVTVVARRGEAGRSCAALAGPSGTWVPAPPAGPPDGPTGAVAHADLVVNATPEGMAPGDGLPFGLDPAGLPAGSVVADLVYAPAVTPLIAAAREAGAEAVNGLGMLIHQAARQIEIWTGQPAPVGEMSAAALAALAHPDR